MSDLVENRSELSFQILGRQTTQIYQTEQLADLFENLDIRLEELEETREMVYQ